MYTRPDVAFGDFRDPDSGAPIPYGRRWETGRSPLPDTYSRVTNPERFEAIWPVARALVDHVLEERAATDADATESYRAPEGTPADVAAWSAPRRRLRDAPPPVRLIAPRGGGPALQVVETATHGVVMRWSGREVRVPVCDCDACDESLEDMTAVLEDFVSDAVLNWPFA